MDRQLVAAERQYARSSERVWACSDGGSGGIHQADWQIAAGWMSFPIRSTCLPTRRRTGVTRRTTGGIRPVLLTYLGAYSYYPNEQAALELINEVLPLLTKRGIRAKVQLVGANPTAAMKAAASRS